MSDREQHKKELVEQSRFVYDTHTGKIVHTYHIGAPTGLPLPTEDEIDERAIEEAARLTKRHRSTLAALSFDRKSLKTGFEYSVHPSLKCLIEGPQQSGAPFAGIR